MNITFEDIWLNLDRQETVKNKIPTRLDWYKHFFTQFGTINITKFNNKQRMTS